MFSLLVFLSFAFLFGMAITQTQSQTPANVVVFTDTNMANAVDAVKAAAATLYSVIIDNSANATSVYVKLFDAAAGGVVLGTTAPDEVLMVKAGKIATYFFFESAIPGKTYANAISAACVTTGGTAGTASPASPVKVSINYV